MQHMTLKAVATATDQGTFTAIISTENHDREGDVVSAPALVKALKAWSRPIPLTWNHSTDPGDVFGAIDPQSARVDGNAVVVDGSVDLDSPRGKAAWPLMKAGVLGFSYGYMVPEGGAVENARGGKDITAIDVFEITGTLTPMNNDTRVIDTKALDALRALEARVNQLEASVKALQEPAPSETEEGATPPPEPVKEPAGDQKAQLTADELAARREIRDALRIALTS